MDHGFSEVISKTKVFELHERFFKLPFQATKCKLAGESEPIHHQDMKNIQLQKGIVNFEQKQGI